MEADSQVKWNYNDIVTSGLISPLSDVGIDYAEIGLDALANNEVIKELPVVKTIASVAKIGLSIKEWSFAKKFLTFLSRYHSGALTEEEKCKFLEKYNQDSSYREKIVTLLVTANDRYFDAKKSEICGNLFVAHVKGLINFDDFKILCGCLDNFSPFASIMLDDLENEKDSYHKPYQVGGDHHAAALIACAFAYQWGTHLYVTYIGMFVHQYGIKTDYTRTTDEIIANSWAKSAIETNS